MYSLAHFLLTSVLLFFQTTHYLGYTVTAGNTGSFGPPATWIATGGFQASENGTITEIDMCTNDGTNHYTLGLYSVAAGGAIPNSGNATQVAVTGGGTLTDTTVTCNTGYTWRGQTASGSIVNGNWYVLALNTNDLSNFNAAYDTTCPGGANPCFVDLSSSYSDGSLPTPVNLATVGSSNFIFEIRVAYTPLGGGGGKACMLLGVC